jgi:hypothetical protein
MVFSVQYYRLKEASMLLVSLLLLAAVSEPMPELTAPPVTAFHSGPYELPVWERWEVSVAATFMIQHPIDDEASERFQAAIAREKLCAGQQTPCAITIHLEGRTQRNTNRRILQSVLRYTISSSDGRRIEGVSWIIHTGAENVKKSVGAYYWIHRPEAFPHVWTERSPEGAEWQAEHELCNELLDLARAAG